MGSRTREARVKEARVKEATTITEEAATRVGVVVVVVATAVAAVIIIKAPAATAGVVDAAALTRMPTAAVDTSPTTVEFKVVETTTTSRTME